LEHFNCSIFRFRVFCI